MFHKSDWQALMTAWHSGKRCQISEEVFNYFLEVLPPVYMNRNVVTLSGLAVRADFGFAEGEEPITAFWTSGDDSVGKRFFLELTAKMARGS
jgi:hypothetical protein